MAEKVFFGLLFSGVDGWLHIREEEFRGGHLTLNELSEVAKPISFRLATHGEEGLQSAGHALEPRVV